jgi:hypothetical protein
VAALDGGLLGTLGAHDHGDPVAAGLDAADLDALAQVDPVGQQRAAHHLDRVGVVLGQDRVALEQGDGGAEPAVGLGELAADRPAAHDDQPVGAARRGRRPSRW